jgi:hypothetical protein
MIVSVFIVLTWTLTVAVFLAHQSLTGAPSDFLAMTVFGATVFGLLGIVLDMLGAFAGLVRMLFGGR